MISMAPMTTKSPKPAPKHGNMKRIRPCIELTLSRFALDALASLAGPGGSRSAVVEALILDAFASKK